METSSIGIPDVWEHAITNLLGHGPDSPIGINLRLWVIHQQFSNDLTEFCAWELHDFALDTHAIHRGALTYLAHHHSTSSPSLQLLLPNQVKQLHGLWQYIVHQSMSGISTIDGTIPSLQPDHWITTTITTFRQWLITFHRGLTNSTPVNISRSLPATQRISHPMPSISPAMQRIPHPCMQIIPASIQVPVPYVAPSLPLDVFPTPLSQDGGEVSHTKRYADFPSITKSCDPSSTDDCPSINTSWNPSNTDTVNKSTKIDVDKEADQFVELVSHHTNHHETCHFETQDSICSQYFDAYLQLQHIIATKLCNPDFSFMFDNIADTKNAAQQWGKPSCKSYSCTDNMITPSTINLQTLADDDPIHDTLLLCYGEPIDPNNGKDIIIGNNIWGVNITSVSHDYGEPITIGNKLWGATLHDYSDNTSSINGENILIGKQLLETLSPSSNMMCPWLVSTQHELDNSTSVDPPTYSSTLSYIPNTTPHVYHSASHVFLSSPYVFLPVVPTYPSINKSWDPPIVGNSNVVLSTKEEPEAHTLEIYQQVQNYHHVSVPSMSYNIVDFKKKVVLSCLENTSHSKTSYTKPWTNTNTTSSPKTLSDEGSTNSTLSSQYGEINDTNPIIIGNNLWGVTTMPTSILDEAYHQKHDYEETVTIGNNLWGEINLNLLSGSILIGNKLWGENLSLLTCTTTM
ncbi:hypothetical protein ACA910_019168 [Epithemia clementina (nom. ined.)]